MFKNDRKLDVAKYKSGFFLSEYDSEVMFDVHISINAISMTCASNLYRLIHTTGCYNLRLSHPRWLSTRYRCFPYVTKLFIVCLN
jgi:hypothetical protein